MTIIQVESVPVIRRGGGITTIPLITPVSAADSKFVTGMSAYPAGTGAPLHKHNCDEQVTVLSGIGEVEINGEVTPLVANDTTYITAGIEHAFRNRGEEPLRILWIYASTQVTRTFSDTGETVEHLSAQDLMSTE